MGYSVSDGRLHGEYGLTGSDSYARWDPSSKVLTLLDVNRTNGLLGFKFESQNPVPDPEFSVPIRHKNAIVRRGSLFSDTERRQFHDFLEDHSQQDNTEDMILTSNDGKQFKVVISISDMHVSNWRIFKEHVNAIKFD
jgi:hypothetical protein